MRHNSPRNIDRLLAERLRACRSDADVPADQAERLARAQALAAQAERDEQLAMWGER